MKLSLPNVLDSLSTPTPTQLTDAMEAAYATDIAIHFDHGLDNNGREPHDYMPASEMRGFRIKGIKRNTVDIKAAAAADKWLEDHVFKAIGKWIRNRRPDEGLAWLSIMDDMADPNE